MNFYSNSVALLWTTAIGAVASSGARRPLATPAVRPSQRRVTHAETGVFQASERGPSQTDPILARIEAACGPRSRPRISARG
jgi:hypothetical protein